jgi:hypothetical protein
MYTIWIRYLNQFTISQILTPSLEVKPDSQAWQKETTFKTSNEAAEAAEIFEKQNPNLQCLIDRWDE